MEWVVTLLLHDSKYCFEFGVPVLHGSFRYGVQLGKIVSSSVGAEASADLLFYLYLPYSSFDEVIQMLV